MSTSIVIIHRKPSYEEFAHITAAVGFKEHPREAVQLALENSWHCVCAVENESVVGVGRIVGDGGMHFYVTNVMVNPAHQRRGIGTQVVEALVTAVKRVQYTTILLEALPLPGLEHFYAKLGFKAPKVYAPGMHLWLNGTRTP